MEPKCDTAEKLTPLHAHETGNLQESSPRAFSEEDALSTIQPHSGPAESADGPQLAEAAAAGRASTSGTERPRRRRVLHPVLLDSADARDVGVIEVESSESSKFEAVNGSSTAISDRRSTSFKRPRFVAPGVTPGFAREAGSQLGEHHLQRFFCGVTRR